MVDSDEPKPKQRARSRARRQPKVSAEEVWVNEFLAVSGTDRVSSVKLDDLGGVGLVRIVEALTFGKLAWSDKCDGPGSDCVFVHKSDEGDVVAVSVWFEATVERLEIRRAWRVNEEHDSEPDAA